MGKKERGKTLRRAELVAIRPFKYLMSKHICVHSHLVLTSWNVGEEFITRGKDVQQHTIVKLCVSIILYMTTHTHDTNTHFFLLKDSF